MGVVLCAHPVHGELHIQRNANREVATTLITKLTAFLGLSNLVPAYQFIPITTRQSQQPQETYILKGY